MAAHFDVNVPLHIKVAITGAVTFTVDLSGVDLEESDDFSLVKHTDAELERLQLLVSAACSRLGNQLTTTNPPTTS